jgi:hypothetical protein
MMQSSSRLQNYIQVDAEVIMEMDVGHTTLYYTENLHEMAEKSD